jgi:hypothetical protein
VVEDHVFAHFPKLWLNFVVDYQLTCIDDAHVHPRLYRVQKEHSMHGLSHMIIAAKRK